MSHVNIVYIFIGQHNEIMSHRGTYHHGNLKNALIEAGMAQLNDKGMSGLSLRNVAKKAGVSHTAPYRHFQDKSQLLSAIAIQGFQQLHTKIQHIVERYPHDPRLALTKACNSFLEMAAQQPKKSQLMFCPHLLISEKTTTPQLHDELKRAADLPKGQLVEVLSEINSQEFLKMSLVLWTSLLGMTHMILMGHIEDLSTEALAHLSEDLVTVVTN